MKKINYVLGIAMLMGCMDVTQAQENSAVSTTHGSTINFDLLKSVDTIPDFNSKPNPMKVTGTVYLSDGKTPAANVVLQIIQPNEFGEYILEKQNQNKEVRHQAMVKTDINGNYTFYTFEPGRERRGASLKSIELRVVNSEQGKESLPSFIFDHDPLLRKSCRKKLAKRNIDNILTLDKGDGVDTGIKNIVLKQGLDHYVFK